MIPYGNQITWHGVAEKQLALIWLIPHDRANPPMHTKMRLINSNKILHCNVFCDLNKHSGKKNLPSL